MWNSKLSWLSTGKARSLAAMSSAIGLGNGAPPFLSSTVFHESVLNGRHCLLWRNPIIGFFPTASSGTEVPERVQGESRALMNLSMTQPSKSNVVQTSELG